MAVFTSCNLMDNEDEPQVQNQFADEVLQQIYQHQDQRQSDSIRAFLKHEKPIYRQKAAEAFGSIQDTNAIAYLQPLLDDAQPEVVEATAYALGQIGSAKALHPLMAKASDASTSMELRSALLEAIGKCANDTALTFLSNYPIKDCPEGVAAGLFRASLKNVISGKGLSVAAALTSGDFSERARLLASSYLSRLRKQDLSPISDRLIHGIRHDINPFVRMNCAAALGYTQSKKATAALEDAVLHDESHLVKINALRGLRRQNEQAGFDVAVQSLSETNSQVAYTATQLIANQFVEEHQEEVKEIMETSKDWRVKALLLGGLIKLDASYSTYGLKELQTSTNPYEQAALIQALASYPENYGFIKERLYTAEHHVVRTAAIDALIQIRNDEKLEELMKHKDGVEKEFAAIFKKAIESKDIGQVYSVAIELRNPEQNYKVLYENFDFLKTARDAMPLPRDIEAYQELQKTIDFFEGKETATNIEKSADHPIDWKLVKSIPQKQRVLLTTSKGDIEWELYVNEAPGTVATIVSLIESGFYNGKTFHRVVSNFVAQGGCPRGDGFGGLDYTIRSEFAPIAYQQGSVGVASAGKDTESCQWFITHSPTPHLDGRYTIFAQVIKGMDVVQKLEIGDLIEHMSLLSSN